MKNRLVVLMSLCLVLILVAGCGKKEDAAVKNQLVKTQRIALGDTLADGTYAGTVRGRYETNMGFQVGGRIISRNVQAGDRVNAGDVLMVIDGRDIVEKSNQGDAQVAAAKAQLDLARANAERYNQLYAQDAVSAAVRDQYQTTYEAAQASYNQAVAGAAQGHNAVGYTTLVAGASGVISAVSAEAGQVVAAGQTVVTMVQTDEKEIEINIPENHLRDVNIGKTVEVNFWAITNGKTTGIVREISPMADPVTKTYRVRVSVPNPPAGLQLGMTASVKCSEAPVPEKALASNVALLPISAIYQTGSAPQVWVVDENDRTISLKTVSVENFGDNQVKVSGLKAGDIVVVAGVHKLREGIKVRLSEDEK